MQGNQWLTLNWLLSLCSERLVKSTADAMVARGFLAAGYKYLVIDDCWMDQKRTHEGKLQGDRQRFPSGIPSIVQYVSITELFN